MRNTHEHPVTNAEMVATLLKLASEINAGPDPRLGDMRPMILEAAARIISTSDFVSYNGYIYTFRHGIMDKDDREPGRVTGGNLTASHYVPDPTTPTPEDNR